MTERDFTIEEYRRLFVHRDDVFAVQQSGGAYLPERRSLTDDDIEEHLAGLWSIGTYVVDPNGHTVSSVVFDLDTHDESTTDTLCELVTRLVSLCQSHESIEQRGLPMLLKEFSGNKGTHVWLFLSEPVPAVRVRRWIAKDFLPLWVSETGGATLEVFPKQDEVTEGGYGNLVKLPLGVHAVSGARSEIIRTQGWANAVCEVQPLDSSLIPDYPPVQVTATRRSAPGHSGAGSRGGDGCPSSPFPCVDQILYDGAGQGQRNQAMFHLALYCYGHAVPEDLALEMCQRANEHFDPPLSDREVEQTLAQAYSGRYPAANCGSDWLRSFCEGPCRVGWNLVSKPPEAGTLRTAQEGSVVEVQIVRRTNDGGRTRLTLAHKDASNQPTLICE